jgi:hypothetical protein
MLHSLMLRPRLNISLSLVAVVAMVETTLQVVVAVVAVVVSWPEALRSQRKAIQLQSALGV